MNSVNTYIREPIWHFIIRYSIIGLLMLLVVLIHLLIKNSYSKKKIKYPSTSSISSLSFLVIAFFILGLWVAREINVYIDKRLLKQDYAKIILPSSLRPVSEHFDPYRTWIEIDAGPSHSSITYSYAASESEYTTLEKIGKNLQDQGYDVTPESYSTDTNVSFDMLTTDNVGNIDALDAINETSHMKLIVGKQYASAMDANSKGVFNGILITASL
jgi:hypothetical protein